MNLDDVIKEEISLLQKWVNTTKNGGWSTHLVKPMQDRILYLKGVLYDYKIQVQADDSR